MEEALEKSLRGLMGLSVRARQAVFGADGCLNALRGGKSTLLLLDETASRATREKYAGVCGSCGADAFLLPEGLLLEATGRTGVAMAVLPGGLCDRIRSLPGMENVRLGSNHDESKNTENLCGGASVE